MSPTAWRGFACHLPVGVCVCCCAACCMSYAATRCAVGLIARSWAGSSRSATNVALLCSPTLPTALPHCCRRCRSQKLDGPYDNRVLPVVVTGVLMTFLTVVWIGSIIRWANACGCWKIPTCAFAQQPVPTGLSPAA